jgi:hypothetical protein
MSTPWGPAPGQDDDRSGAPAPDPYAGAPAPSGYEAKPSWTPQAPVPPSTPVDPFHAVGGTTGGATGADPYGAPQSPYGAPANPYAAADPYGSTTTTGYPGTASADGSAYPGSAYPGSPYAGTPYPTAPQTGGGYPGGAYPGSPYPTTPYGSSPYAGGWAPAPRTEPLAVASLVTSLAGFAVGVSAPVGLGLGIAALRRIRRDGSQGRGMAIAGVVVGSIITAFLVAMLALTVLLAVAADQSTTTSSSWDDGTSTGSGSAGSGSADDGSGGWTTDDTTLPDYTLSITLTAGTCLASQPMEYDMSDAVPVDCGTTHDTEVLSVITLSAPVDEDLLAYDPAYTEAVQTCTATATTALAPVGDLDQLGYVDFYYPHPDQWATGGTSGYCVLVTDAWVSGSVLAGTLTGASTDV